ncbi:TetR/AcrR family transcriptional regulator [Balneolales bacterium ANBcel1]|nr:TetR/AcrR family transcriptional regulator [Balneolales bacterium ANBcel1]
MSEVEKNTEQAIKEAARKIFQIDGYAGARMQAIADEAGINKMMLHYYFRSKQHLFDVIFEEDYTTLMAPLAVILRNPELHVEDQIITFVRRYHDTMITHPRLPLFVVHEFSKNPHKVLEMAQKSIPVSKSEEPGHPGLSATTFMDQIDEGKARGHYHPDVDAGQLAVSMLGMCTYAFISRISVQTAYELTDEQYDKFLEERKEHVIDHTFRILMTTDYYEQWKEKNQKEKKNRST